MTGPIHWMVSTPSKGKAPSRLAEMQTARHFVELVFEEAKGACGRADYQVRGWQAWHHHMALVMVALMFLAKEQMACRESVDLLFCTYLVEIMRHKLPCKIETDADLVASIDDDKVPRILLIKNSWLSYWHKSVMESDKLTQRLLRQLTHR